MSALKYIALIGGVGIIGYILYKQTQKTNSSTGNNSGAGAGTPTDTTGMGSVDKLLNSLGLGSSAKTAGAVAPAMRTAPDAATLAEEQAAGTTPQRTTGPLPARTTGGARPTRACTGEYSFMGADGSFEELQGFTGTYIAPQ